ncbi:MAG: hypothetical protein DMF80_04110 [Acidobacteria bacterium]|nr:MAG: hypothetical protein DMF80_04110 [Acidobacteriota bacterium]PYQ22563.1 MAG: hypothetical protein DMF81_11695 [Acidobacteriota bacterium]
MTARGRAGAGFLSFLKRKEPSDLRFYLRALQEADPDFGEESEDEPDADSMSREWLTRSMR